jgi:hypothetical protein
MLFFILAVMVMLAAIPVHAYYRGREVEYCIAQRKLVASAARNQRLQRDRLRLIRRGIFNQFIERERAQRSAPKLDPALLEPAQSANSSQERDDDLIILLDDFLDAPEPSSPEPSLLPHDFIGGDMEPTSPFGGSLQELPPTPSVSLPDIAPVKTEDSDELGARAYEEYLNAAAMLGLPITDAPTPGSEPAVACGCTCDCEVNCEGVGYLGGVINPKTGRTVYVYTNGCPVHWPEEIAAKLQD